MRRLLLTACVALAGAAVLWRFGRSGDPGLETSPSPSTPAAQAEGAPLLQGAARAKAPGTGLAPESGAAPSPASLGSAAGLVVAFELPPRADPAAPLRVLVLDGSGRNVAKDGSAGEEFLFEGLAAGKATIEIEADGLLLGGDAAAALTLGTRTRLESRLEAGVRLEGRVLDERTGAPVQGARLDVRGGGEIGGMQSSGGRASYGAVVTDAEGRFRTRGLPFDFIVTLRVEASGFRRAERPLLLQPVEGARAPLEIRLAPGGTVRGVVRDADGRAAVGAIVTVGPAGDVTWQAEPLVEPADGGMRPPGTQLLRALADGEGAFVASGLALGQELCAVAALAGHGNSPPLRGLVLTETRSELVAELVLARPAHVLVRVIDADGRPVSSGHATLGPEWGESFPVSEAGVLDFGAVAPGEHALRLGVPGFVPVREILRVQAGQRLDHTVRLDPGVAISGVVVDDLGEPLSGVWIAAAPRDDEGWGSGATSDAQGRFHITGLQRGVHGVRARGREDSMRPVEPVAAPTQGLRLVLVRGGWVRARFRPPSGATAPKYLLVGSYGPKGGGHAGSQAWEDGVVEWEVPAGKRDLRVEAQGYAPWRRVVDVEPAGILDLGELVLDVGVTLRGRVVDAAGAPIAGAVVETAGHVDAKSQSGVDGRFSLAHLPRQTVRVVAQADGYVAASSRAALEGEAPELTLTMLRGGVLAVRLLPASGPLPEELIVHVQAIDTDDPDAPGRWDYADPDAEGCSRSRLLPGRYRVQIQRDGKEVVPASEVVLTDGLETALEVHLP